MPFGQVDERLYSLLSTSNILEAVKLTLVSSASELTTRALGELKQQVGSYIDIQLCTCILIPGTKGTSMYASLPYQALILYEKAQGLVD